jgi:hypothetical protein
MHDCERNGEFSAPFWNPADLHPPRPSRPAALFPSCASSLEKHDLFRHIAVIKLTIAKLSKVL